MSELTLPDAARSNTVKQLDRRSRGNLKCKYMLFLVQISMQMHTLLHQRRCAGLVCRKIRFRLILKTLEAIYQVRGSDRVGMFRITRRNLGIVTHLETQFYCKTISHGNRQVCVELGEGVA